MTFSFFGKDGFDRKEMTGLFYHHFFFLLPQFQLKAPPRGTGTPAERGGPTENKTKCVTDTHIHHALALILRDCTCSKPSAGLQSKGKHSLVHNVCSFFSS